MMGGGKGGEESLPLPVPLLLKYDILDTAGDPKEVKKKWKPVGSQGRGDTDRRHRGLGRVKWGGASSKEIKKAPKSLLTSHRGLTFGTLWEAGEGGVWGGCQSKEPTLPQNSVPPPTHTLLRAVLSVCSMAVF